jgi:hypothetical protein
MGARHARAADMHAAERTSAPSPESLAAGALMTPVGVVSEIALVEG